MTTPWNPNEEVLTLKELAFRLRVSNRTILRWMAKGKVQFRRVGGSVRFLWTEVAGCQGLGKGKQSTEGGAV